MIATDTDFLLLALEGLRARLEVLDAQAEAIRQAAAGLNGRPKMGRPKKAPATEPEPEAPISRQKAIWTPERRAEKAALARKMWKKGVFGPKKGKKAATTTGKKWTPAERKRLSAAMKKAHARKTGAVLPQAEGSGR